jgi:hypothetical protein
LSIRVPPGSSVVRIGRGLFKSKSLFKTCFETPVFHNCERESRIKPVVWNCVKVKVKELVPTEASKTKRQNILVSEQGEIKVKTKSLLKVMKQVQ